MQKQIIPLSTLPLGEKCKVLELQCEGSIRRRLLDLGVIENTEITALQISPSGDPVAYFIRGAVIALRADITSKIMVLYEK